MSHVYETGEECLQEALKLAKTIAEKSPVSITATKLSLNYSRDHTVEEGLQHIATLNSALLQSTDLQTAAMAMMQKTKPVFPKL